MRIAVSGAHRTGKTSLVAELVVNLPDYVCEQEPYHLLEEAGHVFPEIPGPDDFVLQLEYSIKQIIESGENMVFDRCPVDILAYLKAIDIGKTVDLEPLSEKIREAMTSIDLLVFLPVEDPDLIGCAEPEFPKLRIQVDEILEDSIWDLDIEVLEVRGSLEQRKVQVLERLASKSRGSN